MHQFLPFIVIGLATGGVYGLAGTGLVLTYKTSGILNFGYGAIAALNAFLFYYLHTERGMPWPFAALICLVALAPVLGIAMELLSRSLSSASDSMKVVVTVGLILIVESIGLLWIPTNPPTFDHFLPQSTVRILGVNITWEQIILFVFSVLAAAVLYWFFRFVRLGVVMRGVVDNAELVSMSGDNLVWVRRWAWIIGTVYSSIAGLMLAPTQSVDAVSLTTLVFAAFGAAAIGLFRNLPLTFVGGLVIGIAGALVSKYSVTIPWIAGLSPSLPFVVLFLVLVFTPPRLLAQRRLVSVARVRPTYHAPPAMRLLAGAIVLGLLASIPGWQSAYVSVWSAALIEIILFLSLGLLVRRSGQISLCQLAFAAVGAASFGHFTALHIPWLFALVLTALVVLPVSALIAIPAVRISGVYLALLTLGFGIVMDELFYTQSYFFGDSPLGIEVPRPDVSIGGWNLASGTGFYYVLLIATVLAVVIIIAIGRGRLGRLLAAMADAPLALETHGTTTSVLKVIVFCISAAMASVAGAFTGMLDQYVVGTYFQPFDSLTLMVLVVVVTIGEPWFAVIGAVAYTVIPGYVTGSWAGRPVSTWLELLFGVAAAAAAFTTHLGGTPRGLQVFLNRFEWRRTPAVTATGADPAARRASESGARVDTGDTAGSQTGLAVRNLSVAFGGVKAVSNLSLKAPKGVITGLVGPNGAGKTTTFNACSGLIRPGLGEISLNGFDVTKAGTAQRARLGLGRTFQRTELFNSLTVRQNVAMGRESALGGRNPFTQVASSRRANRLITDATEEALALTGIGEIAHSQVGLLPLGQRRLVELARTLAGHFDLLLLDEPSSGLDVRETEAFGVVLQSIVHERGCGILLVEHDMTLIRDICDYVYVLDFGTLIFAGTPDEMHQSADVRAAYLGDAGSLSVPVQAEAGVADVASLVTDAEEE